MISEDIQEVQAHSPAAVVCIATDGFEHLWTFCIDSHREYTQANGYDYILINENPWPDLMPHWSKLRACLPLLRRGTDILLIDSDAFIRAGTPRFQDILARYPGKDIFAALGVSDRPNSGVVILRGGERSLAAQFLQLCIDNRALAIPKEDRVTAHGENGHFIHFLKRDPFATRFQVLGTYWNKTSVPVKSTDYILHFTSQLRSGKAVLDGTVPFFPDTTRDRLARLYYSFRSILLVILKRVRLIQRLVGWVGTKLASATGLAIIERGKGSFNALWKIESSLGLLEHPTILLCRKILKKGDTIIDGGAHIGYLSRLFGKVVGVEGRVFSIEAHPQNAVLLRTNVTKLAAAVTVIQAALMDADGTTVLFEGTGHSNHSVYGEVHARGATISTPARTLDAIALQYGIASVNLLKLDIEGAELNALKGAEHLIDNNFIDVILIEVNPSMLTRAGTSAAELATFLAAKGYQFRQIRDDYRLGPVGFIDRKDTYNYVCAKPEKWSQIFQLIRR